MMGCRSCIQLGYVGACTGCLIPVGACIRGVMYVGACTGGVRPVGTCTDGVRPIGACTGGVRPDIRDVLTHLTFDKLNPLDYSGSLFS